MPDILTLAIPATAGLFGVAVGGYLSARSQRIDRKHRFVRDQLGEFYGPMLAAWMQIKTKRALSIEIMAEADSAWRETIGRANTNIDAVQKIMDDRFPAFEKITDYNNRQFLEDTIPAYRRMVELFTSKMHFAESSTRQYFRELVEFTEVLNRSVSNSIPREVSSRIDTSDAKLGSFYAEIESTFEKLQKALR
jgi:hypothetical protein